jgi:hypothetical protein
MHQQGVLDRWAPKLILGIMAIPLSLFLANSFSFFRLASPTSPSETKHSDATSSPSTRAAEESNREPLIGSKRTGRLATTSAQLSDFVKLETNIPADKWALATLSTAIDPFRREAILISDPANANSHAVALKGKTWVSIIKPDDFQTDPSAIKMPDDWQDHFILGGLKFEGYSSDGSRAVGGLIREKSGFVQVRLETDRPIDVAWDYSDGYPQLLPIPPYRREYDVFVSDWTTISGLLEQYRAVPTGK